MNAQIKLLVLLSIAFSFLFSEKLMRIHNSDGSVTYKNIGLIDKIDFIETDQGNGWCLVPAGVFTFGDDDETRTINYDFEIMKYEVTNAQYITYLNAAYNAGDIIVDDNYVESFTTGNRYYDLAAGIYANYGQIIFEGGEFKIAVPTGYNVGDFDNHPVVEVSAYGAMAFAIHYGWSLPSIEEWEKAARSTMGWDFPWGDVIGSNRANYSGSGDPFENGTTPIGYYNGVNAGTVDSPSPYGCYDMAGNVLEWTRTEVPGGYIAKGGSYKDTNTDLLKSWGNFLQNYQSTIDDLGFRCVRNVPAPAP